ncbi:MAG: hypothetical protein R3C49_02990 [Planctomycetaceae bacterium]
MIAAGFHADQLEIEVGPPDLERIRPDLTLKAATLQLVTRWTYICEGQSRFSEAAVIGDFGIQVHLGMLHRTYPEFFDGPSTACMTSSHRDVFRDEISDLLLAIEIQALRLVVHLRDAERALTAMLQAEELSRRFGVELDEDQSRLLGELKDGTCFGMESTD